MFFVFLSEEALDLEFTEKTLHNLTLRPFLEVFGWPSITSEPRFDKLAKWF